MTSHEYVVNCIACLFVALFFFACFLAALSVASGRLKEVHELVMQMSKASFAVFNMTQPVKVFYYTVRESKDQPPEKVYHVVEAPISYRVATLFDLLSTHNLSEHVYMNIHNSGESRIAAGKFAGSEQLRNLLCGYTDKAYIELGNKEYAYVVGRVTNVKSTITKTSPV